MDWGWGAPLCWPPGGFLSSASPGRGPGVVLCDAGPQGGSAYLAMGAEGSSPFLEVLSHQLAGLNATLPSPRALTCQRRQGGQGGAGSLCQGPHLSLGLGSVYAPASKLCVSLHVAYVKMCGCESAGIRPRVYVYMCASVHNYATCGRQVHVCTHQCVNS